MFMNMEYDSYLNIMLGGIMLSRYQFEVLRACREDNTQTQRSIAASTGISIGSVNKAVKDLLELDCIDETRQLTEKGEAALIPYKVDNAIILAAGMATRFAPLSFERPKAMFEVRGEILIERLIRQLREAGINDITVVVGDMKEAFFYLEDSFGIKIVVNRDYATHNNHSSIWSVKEFLGNSYVISSDQYYPNNIFKSHNFESYCSALYEKGYVKGRVLKTDAKNNVVELSRDGSDAYVMRGPAYFDREFSRKYVGFLTKEYDQPEIANKLWEDIFAEHIPELHMVMKEYSQDDIHEFNYLSDLTAFDRDFFINVDSRILDNICHALDCTREDITNVKPIKAGLTNLSTLFTAKGVKYIYRHPGNGTEEIVNREAEELALRIACELGLDDTFVYEDPREGWKISRYIEGCSELDYSNKGQVAKALQMARKLHTSGKTSPWSFDFYKEGAKIANLLQSMGYPLPRDFDQLASRISALAACMREESSDNVLCHNDFYGPNFLVRDDEMRLIDWEYAAMGDPACDIGNFVAQGSGYSVEETLEILPLYYGRPATEVEQRHCLAAVAVVGWYWYVWAMYKEAMGNPVGEWLYVWYQAAKTFTAAAEPLYKGWDHRAE